MNRAVRFDGGVASVVETERPEVAAGALLVETTRSLISPGTELALLHGHGRGETWSRIRRSPYGTSPGSSVVGRVVEVGAGVDAGAWQGRRVHVRASHAAWVTVPATDAVLVPDLVSDDVATLATLAATAMNAVRRGGLEFGESVAVVGLGLLGQLAVRWSLFAGARPVLGFNRSAERLLWLPPAATGHAGADAAALARVVRSANGGELADVVIDAAGDESAVRLAATLARDRVVLLGSPNAATSFDFHDLCNFTSLTLVGAHVRSHAPPWTLSRHVALFFARVASGDIEAASLVSHGFEAASVAEAYAAAARSTETMGVVLRWR